MKNLVFNLRTAKAQAEGCAKVTKSSRMAKILTTLTLLLTLCVGQMWGGESFWQVDMTYSFNGTTGLTKTFSSSDNKTAATDLGTMSSGTFTVTKAKWYCWADWQDNTYCFMWYNINGGDATNKSCYSSGASYYNNDKGNHYPESNYTWTIANSTDASGSYTLNFGWYSQFSWGDGNNQYDIKNSQDAGYQFTYKIAPPAVSGFSVSTSGYLAGSGTSGDPYLVKSGNSLTFTVAGSKEHTDGNSTLKYWLNSGSKQNSSTITISNITATTNQEAVIHAQCINNSTSSLVGTESTSSTIYYKAVSVKDITVYIYVGGCTSDQINSIVLTGTPYVGSKALAGVTKYIGDFTTDGNWRKYTFTNVSEVQNLVVARSAGRAVDNITATADVYAKWDGTTLDGKCVPLTTPTWNTAPANGAVGGSMTATINNVPAGATVTWNSTASSYASVNSSGVISYVATGSATIEARIQKAASGDNCAMDETLSQAITVTSGATVTATRTCPAYVSTGAGEVTLDITSTGASSGWYYRIKNKSTGGYYAPDNQSAASNALSWTMTGGIGAELTTLVVELYNGSNTLICTSSDVTVTGEVAHITYIAAGSNGSVSPTTIYANNNHVHPSITATPNSHYHFKDWTSNNAAASVASATSATTTVTATAGGYTITANFEGDQYTITYKDKDNAAYSGSNQASLPATHTYGTATALVNGVRSGYTFVGWYMNPECTGDAVTSIGATSQTGNFTLYAKWTEKMTTITVNVNPAGAGTLTVGGAAFTPGNTTTAGVATSRTVVATKANDYAFSSWSVTGNATGTSSTNTYTLKGNGSAGTGTLTANFTLVPCKLYKLSAAKNGSTTDKGAMSYDPTEHAYYKDITTDASPYYFRFYYNNIAQYCTNWSSTSGGDAYTSGKQIAANGSKVDCNQSVGGWDDKPAMYYSGESGTTIRIWFDYQNKKVWITADKDKQYVLRGANADDASKADGMPGWGATTSYFVGLASGNTGTVSCSLNAAEWYHLKVYDMYNKTWYGTSTSGAKELTDGTLSTMGSYDDFYFGTTIADSYTFTLDKSSGMKIKVDYPVSYQLNYSIGSVAGTEGSITTSPSTPSGSYVPSGNVVTLTAPTEKTGYSWDGWYLNAAGTGDKQCATKAYDVTMNAAKTLYACYTQDDYTITLNGNGGTGHTASVTAHYGEFAPVDDGVGGHKFSITNPNHDGYTFAGWYTNSDGTGTMLINPDGYLTWSIDGFTDGTGKWIATSGTNLYARWKTNASVGNYNFQYGSGTWYSSSWTLMNFGDADDHERTIDFTLIDPTSKKFFVGYDGDFQSVRIGEEGTAGASSEENLSNLRLAPGTLSVGSAIGATGKLVIFDNSSEENLYVGFKPNGYGLTYAGGTKAFSEVSDHLWQTNIVTLTSSDVAGSFKVGLLSATPGSYVDCSTMTATDNAAALNTRKNALVTEQSYPAIPNLAAGQEGRFVIWDNDSHAGQQWYLCFLPVYSITYNDNGASSGSVPVDANKYRTNETPTVLGNSGSLAKEGYAFSGWNTAPDGSGTAYTVGSNLEAIGDNVILYAQYRKAEITDVVLNAGIFEPVAAGDPATYVTADPTLDPTPAPTIKLCWELRYSNDNPVAGEDYKAIPVSGNQVKFLLNGLAAGGYKIHVELRTGSTCGAGELLSSYDKSFSIASDHTVTIQYRSDSLTGPVIKASTTNPGKPLEGTEITAPEIIGYTFSKWKAGDGVTIEGADANGEKASATITYTANYDGVLTAIYSQKRMIYFYNSLGWSNVYVYFYNTDEYWSDTYGSGAQKNQAFNGDHKPYWEEEHGTMTQIEGTNIWYYDCNAMTERANVVFTKDNKHDNQWFYQTEAVRRDDYNRNLPMYVPIDLKTQTINETDYYNTGYWMNYPENTGYTLRIYNSWDANNSTGAAREYPFPFSADTKMPLKLGVEFNFTGQAWFMIYRKDGQLLGKKYTMKQEYHETALDVGSIDKIEIKTSAAGEYKFTLSYLNIGTEVSPNYQYYIYVEYPVSIGDYRILYKDGATWSQSSAHDASWYHESDIIRKNSGEEAKADTVSLFVSYGSSPSAKFQKVTAIDNNTGVVTWTDVASGTVSLSSIEEKGVYNFIVSQPAGGASISLTKTEKYTGNFYIRTDCAGTTKWDNYRAFDHQMTYTEYSMSAANSFGDKYSHYYCHWCPRNTNIKFCVANDYSSCISDTLEYDLTDLGNLNAGGQLKHEDGKSVLEDRYSANVRFMYNQETNKISRAYVASSTNAARKFLVLRGNQVIKGEDGSTAINDQSVTNGAILSDKENWIYERILYINPGTRFKLFACYAEATPTEAGAQYFRGAYDSNNFTTDANSVILISGTGGYQKARILYDFKTNRLVCAWLPSEEAITSELDIDADVMVIRDHQEAAECITFSGDGSKLTYVKTVYGVMKFNRWTLNNRYRGLGGVEDNNKDHCDTPEDIAYYHGILPAGEQKSVYERSLYFISFPFDVKVSEIFGFGTYGKHWVLEYYDGLNRAKNGYWIDSSPNWKYVTPSMAKTYELKAYEGYILCLSLGRMAYDNTEVWPNNISNVELYFPSKTPMTNIQTTNVNISGLNEIAGDPYRCTINREGEDGDRRVKDSYWRCLGVPSYNLYAGQLKEGEGGSTINWQTNYNTFPFLYAWNMTDNTLTPQATNAFSFKPMHAYLTQIGTAIYWTNVSATPAVMARQTEEPTEYNWRLTLNAGEQMIDQTYVRMSTDEVITNEFDFGQDLSKELNTGRSDIYSFIGNERAAANSLQMNTETTTVVRLGLNIEATGDYTFSIPDGTNGIGITLIDEETGIRTSLSALDYTVELAAGDYTERFWLEISPVKGAETGIDPGVDARENGVRKVMIDGLLYIVRDGKMYDATGKRVE